MRVWLKDEGLSTDSSGGGDVSIVPQANADTLNAFKADQIAGAWVPEPWATRLVQEGGGKILVDEATLWPEGRYVTTHLIVRTAFLDEHPGTVKAVLEGHLAALDLIASDPAKAQKRHQRPRSRAHPEAAPRRGHHHLMGQPGVHPGPHRHVAGEVGQGRRPVGLLEPVDLKGIYDLQTLNGLLAADGADAVKGL